jgi:hypothetical protein
VDHKSNVMLRSSWCSRGILNLSTFAKLLVRIANALIASQNVYQGILDAPKPSPDQKSEISPLLSIPFTFCLLPYQAVHHIPAEVLVPVEALDSDLVHLVVLELENHRAHQEVVSGNLEESHRAEGKAYRLEGLEVERRLVGRVEMACHGRLEEEGRLAYQTVEEACLLTLERGY